MASDGKQKTGLKWYTNIIIWSSLIGWLYLGWFKPANMEDNTPLSVMFTETFEEYKSFFNDSGSPITKFIKRYSDSTAEFLNEWSTKRKTKIEQKLEQATDPQRRSRLENAKKRAQNIVYSLSTIGLRYATMLTHIGLVLLGFIGATLWGMYFRRRKWDRHQRYSDLTRVIAKSTGGISISIYFFILPVIPIPLVLFQTISGCLLVVFIVSITVVLTHFVPNTA